MIRHLPLLLFAAIVGSFLWAQGPTFLAPSFHDNAVSHPVGNPDRTVGHTRTDLSDYTLLDKVAVPDTFCPGFPDLTFHVDSLICNGDSLNVFFTLCNEGDSVVAPFDMNITLYGSNPTTSAALVLGSLTIPVTGDTVLLSDTCWTGSFALHVFDSFPGGLPPNLRLYTVINDDSTFVTPFSFDSFPSTGLLECDYFNNLDSFDVISRNFPTLDLGPDIALCTDTFSIVLNAGGAFATYEWQDGSTNSTFTVTAYGTYTVKVTDDCGAAQLDSIIIGPNLLADTQFPDTSVCPGNSITLYVPGFDTYLWSPASGLSCTDCDSVTITPDSTTTYTLLATDSSGCELRDTFVVSIGTQIALTDSISLCAGDSISIGDSMYTAPNVVQEIIPDTTGGCDTVALHILVLLPQPSRTDTISFCPGAGVTIGDSTYTLPGTVTETVADTITGGCDTLLTHVLVALPQPTRTDTISFCPGAGVTIGDSTFTVPGTVTETVADSTSGGCDTLVTHVLVQLPQPTRTETINFCAGDGVTIGDSTFTQGGTAIDTIAATVGGACDTIVTYTLVMLPLPTSTATISFCAGDSITIGDSTFTQAGTAIDTLAASVGNACDTIVTYTLVLLPQPTVTDTITFCGNAGVTIGDSTYFQAGNVTETVADTLTGGCDTLITHVLVALPQPTASDTIFFCPGSTLTFGDSTYTQPGIAMDTIGSTTGGCDTLFSHFLKFYTLPQPSNVTVTCPAGQTVEVPFGTTGTVLNYTLPTTTSDCPCGGPNLSLTSGQISGSNFPVGTNNVCYTVQDSCGSTASCCFTLQVNTASADTACDVKTIGCMKYELLSITANFHQDRKYRIRVTNTCAAKMIYTVFEVPNGETAMAPANNSVYTAPSGRQYDVRNPNFQPFYSIRFKSKTDSISNGQSDIFEYQLPSQIAPSYIHVATRLSPATFYEAYINTFKCPIDNGAKPAGERGAFSGEVSVFPNPTSGEIFADLSVWQGQSVRLRVLDAQGREVWSASTTAGSEAYPINLSQQLANGLFTLDVITESGERDVVRFVLEK